MVTLILTRIVFVLSIPLCLYAVYFGVVALFGLRKKLPAAPQAKPEKRFALVVAARNEAAVIGHLVDSLYGQDYPRELYEVIVAPNNCTDDTEAVAAGRGARIFCPEGVIRSKGEVLTQVVDKIVLAEEFDAMCVFDADNLVDGQFLARMNDALVSGAQVAQGFRDSKNPEQSAISGCYSICYWMLNRFYNGARSALHLSALVNGSGFAVTTALLRRLGGWHTVTMTEDYEFSAQCAMLGERVHFVPEALIYDEQPLTFRQSWKQRRRWTTGSLQGLQNYGHGLFSSFVLHGSLICLDMYLTFLVPMVQLASVVLGIAGLVLTLLGSGITFGGIMLHGMMLAALMTAGGFVASVVGSAVFAAFTVALKNESLSGMAKGILAYWVFLMSQMVLTLLSFVKKQEKWEPIAHTSAKRLEDMRTAWDGRRPSQAIGMGFYCGAGAMEKRGTRPLAVSRVFCFEQSAFSPAHEGRTAPRR